MRQGGQSASDPRRVGHLNVRMSLISCQQVVVEEATPGSRKLLMSALFRGPRGQFCIECFVRALNEPDVHKRLYPLAQKPVPGTPADFGDFIRSQYVLWGKAVKATGAKAN